jgi:DNA-binding transcriptional ArsR family regulator
MVTYNHMVVETEFGQRTDQLFHALADGTRRDIVRRSLTGHHSVSELARHYPMSFAAVQKHVAVLERAGLVTKERTGREQRVRSNIESVRAAHRVLDALETVWRERIDRFGDVLTSTRKRAKP